MSMRLDLPPEFVETIQNTFGAEGKRWLDAFPSLLDEACQRWDLIDIQPVPNLSYNFVAMAQSGASDSSRSAVLPTRPSTVLRSAQDHIVLKLGVPNRELTSEIAALRFYGGQGACRLLDAEVEKGMLLLERLQPGHMLTTFDDDEHATRIAAEVMRQLWQSSSDFSRYQTATPAPRPGREPIGMRRSAGGAGEIVTTNFIQLTNWFNGFERLRKRYNGKTGPLPQRLVETAESLSRELLIENKEETLLHGDFHHFNVLNSERGWLAIDPKGVIGPRGYEVGPLLINPMPDFLNGSNPRIQTEKRIAILSEMLDMERERIRSWAICHAVLSAWWNLEDKEDWKYAARCAEIFTVA